MGSERTIYGLVFYTQWGDVVESLQLRVRVICGQQESGRHIAGNLFITSPKPVSSTVRRRSMEGQSGQTSKQATGLPSLAPCPID